MHQVQRGSWVVGHGSLKFGGIGWVLNRYGSWQVVVAWGLRIVVDQHADHDSEGMESTFLGGGGDYVVAISCGCGCCWWFLEA